jgi:hypothetical protein
MIITILSDIVQGKVKRKQKVHFTINIYNELQKVQVCTWLQGSFVYLFNFSPLRFHDNHHMNTCADVSKF